VQLLEEQTMIDETWIKIGKVQQRSAA